MKYDLKNMIFNFNLTDENVALAIICHDRELVACQFNSEIVNNLDRAS